MNQFPKNFFVFAMGFFAIASQTLLFREFITSFESNDIAVAIFFSSWFLWIAISAWIFGKFENLAAKLAENIKLILLFYIPAYALQLFLIIQVREIAGIPSYNLFPINRMVLMAILLNLPVSFLTGIVFPATCRWLTEETDIPVSKVYFLEAVGSVSGGLAVTLLLFLETNNILIFFLISLLVAIAVALVYEDPIKRRTAFFPALILAVLIFGRFDLTFLQKIQKTKWSKLLPTEAYQGSFATAKSEYLYGTYNHQFLIISNGTVCTTVPDRESAATTIAANLSQNPSASNILIIGSGFNICNELLESSQIKQIYWFYPDNQFIEKVNNLLSADNQVTSPRIKIIKEDIRNFLNNKNVHIDSVIINLADPDSAASNRYFTQDFLEQLKNILNKNGVIGVQISGGENVMGNELALIGASVRTTLQQVFDKVVIKPGENTWFLASDNKNISDEPEVLVKNFAKFANADAIFPPDGLFSIYQPDRSADANRIYNKVDLPKKYLLNRDAEPHVYLYELLLACKQSGWQTVNRVKDLLHAWLAPYLAIAGVLTIIWFFYARKGKNCGAIGENVLLVMISGLLSIGTVIVLMFLYQTRFGSLFLHVGLISSLFMIGLSGGTILTRYLTIQRQIKIDKLMFIIIAAQIILFFLIAFGRPFTWNHLAFALAFLFPGFCNGIFFPIAATRLEKLEVSSGKSGGLLENADHLGATLGALISGLLLIPLIGSKDTLILFAIILAINIPIAINRILKGEDMKTQSISLKRQIGFFIIGTIILIFTFALTVKLAGEPKGKKNNAEPKKTEKEVSTLKKEKPKTVEDILGPPPKADGKVEEENKEKDEDLPPPGSDVKKVDLPKIKKMIKEKKLSDHEAEFYKKFE